MSQKLKDEKNRWRNKTVGFRVSPEEWDALEEKVKLCGFQKKQDYIMECLVHHKVTARGNPLMLTQFRSELKKISDEIRAMEVQLELLEEMSDTLKVMLEVLEGFNKNEENKG